MSNTSRKTGVELASTYMAWVVLIFLFVAVTLGLAWVIKAIWVVLF